MNKVILIGNVVADPELRYTPQNNIACCTFRIAVQRKYPNQQGVREADFFNCVAWRQTGENIHKFFKKGQKIPVVGSLQNRSYEVDGQKRYVTEVLVDEFDFVQAHDTSGGGYAPPPPPEPSYQPPQATQTKMNTSGFTEVDDDELPF